MWILAVLVVSGVGTMLPAPADAQSNAKAVWCHDEKRSIVRRKEPSRCKGTIVSAAEAERIKQQRVRRIQRVLERERNPVVPGKKLVGTGTGFFISGDGHALTNAHVVAKCTQVTVSPPRGEPVLAKITATDPSRDLALLETGEASPDWAQFRDFDEVIANEPVTVIGYPLHGKVVIRPVLVSGHVRPGTGNVSAFAMNIDIRRGNSGGPVLDEAGRVIGVVFAKVDTPAVFAKTGKRVSNVGLGLRLRVVRDFLQARSLRLDTSEVGTALELHTRLEQASKFLVQVGCWR